MWQIGSVAMAFPLSMENTLGGPLRNACLGNRALMANSTAQNQRRTQASVILTGDGPAWKR